MKTAISALAAASLLMSAQPARASFLKRLINTAVQAAGSRGDGSENLVTQIVGQAIDAASRQREPKAEGGAPPAEAAQADADEPAAAPAPEAKKASYPSDIKPSEAVASQKQAFLDFSRYDCRDCEGGHGFDAWAGQILNLKGDHAWEAKVGALEVGGTIEWQGKASDGAASVTSEGDVQGFRCKQVHYTLMRRGDGQLAERDGLFCFGKPEPYVTSERWVEVY